MRFHLLGLAHTATNRDYMLCAYTQKVFKLAHMLTDLGHEVVHYGAEGSDVPCDHIQVISKADQREAYGDYDWRSEFFRHDPQDHAYKTFANNAIRELRASLKDRDTLLVPFGNYQENIAQAVSAPFTVELGVGYSGVFSNFRVFESYAWMHYVYGQLGVLEGNFYDAVIPNYFDPNDFTFQARKGDYLAYIGRLTHLKGVQTAIDVARETGRELILAGQGDLSQFNTDGANVNFVGSVNSIGRNEIFSGAHAALAPSLYIEPFGGVAVEAQFCGTPVLTTDWGAFPETVEHGVTGFRCHTFGDFVRGVDLVGKLKPRIIRRRAEQNYSMKRVALMYDEYFRKLQHLYGDGWYETEDVSDHNWLRKQHGYLWA
jgi:glycosyltransferase involved in cell wall biosynthesis